MIIITKCYQREIVYAYEHEILFLFISDKLWSQENTKNK